MAWRWLRARLADQPDSEHEQIIVRIGFAIVILAYLLASIGGTLTPATWKACLAIVLTYAVCALLLFAHILWQPGINVGRRCSGMALDLICLPACMIFGEAWFAPLYPMFLWISFGMGFRYGRAYLFAAVAASLVGFGAVIALTDFWGSQPVFSSTLWIALLILPAYASTLLKKLTVALDRAEAANQAKGRFVASMSHELRTPLNAIIGMSDLLNIERLTPQQHDMARTIKNAGETLLDMVDDVLNIAQIESEPFTPAKVDFDLHAALASVRYLHHQAALEKGLDLRLTIAPDVPSKLHGCVRSLRQILVNLVTNAIKFTDQGHVVIKVSSTPADDGRLGLCITVSDTGCGIALEDQERIFDRFTQAGGAAGQEAGGAGLGLAIARQLTGLLGGRLSVDSEVGKGAHFSLFLPFERLPETDPALRGCIVVVGDETRTAPLCRQLQRWGGDVANVREPADISSVAGAKRQGQWAVLFVRPKGAEHLSWQAPSLVDGMGAVGCNVVLIGERSSEDSTAYIVELGEEPKAAELFNAVHAALALPTGIERVPSSIRSAKARKPVRILLAEDNPVNCKVISKMLHYGGHAVTVVNDGQAMLDVLEEEMFGLVLFDLNMPGISGLDAFQLYRFGTSDDQLPFVALTADATEEAQRRCLDAGIDGYLTKPVKLEELLALVDRLAGADDIGHSADLSQNVVRHPRFESQLPIVDHGSLDRLRLLSQGDNFLSEVLAEFIEDTENLVKQLEAAMREGDAQAFRDTAHALRSSAAYIGAKRLVDLCLGWRGVTPEDIRRDGTASIQQLKVEVDRLRQALQDVIAAETKRATIGDT